MSVLLPTRSDTGDRSIYGVFYTITNAVSSHAYLAVRQTGRTLRRLQLVKWACSVCSCGLRMLHGWTLPRGSSI